MGKPLSADALVDAAMAATGLSDFGGDSFREGLDILIADTNADTDRPDDMVERVGGMYTKILMDRLKVVDAVNRRPEVMDAPIPRPVFIFGIPRTGTTLINNLLAADPNRRSMLLWELNDPVPPPRADQLYTDPRCLAQLEAEKAMLAANPAAGRIYRMSAV